MTQQLTAEREAHIRRRLDIPLVAEVHVASLGRELLAELARVRPVVEATASLLRWLDHSGPKGQWPTEDIRNARNAIDTYRAAKPAATNELTIAPLDGWDDDPTPEPDFSVDVEPALVPECDAAKALAEWAKVDVGRRLTVYADIRANCDDEAMLTALDALEGLTEATAAALLLADGAGDVSVLRKWANDAHVREFHAQIIRMLLNHQGDEMGRLAAAVLGAASSATIIDRRKVVALLKRVDDHLTYIRTRGDAEELREDVRTLRALLTEGGNDDEV